MNLIRRLFSWYFNRRKFPYWGILLIDAFIVFLSCCVALYLNPVDNFNWSTISSYGLTLMLIVFVYGLSFSVFHTYTGIVRFSTFVDLQYVVFANASAAIVSTIFFVGCRALHIPFFHCPSLLSTLVIFTLSTLLMWLERVAVKRLYDTFRQDSNTKNVFIYGVSTGGVSLAKSIQGQNPLQYKLVGFVTPNEELYSKYLMGALVYHDNERLITHMQEKHARILLVSPLQSEYFRSRQKLISDLLAHNIRILMMPAAEEWNTQKDLSHNQLHEVEIEDLLPRKKIEVDMDAIGQMLTGKRILITGAAGSIGSEMSNQVAKFAPAELILVDQAETPMHNVRLYMAEQHKELKVWTIVGSITNEKQMEEIFRTHRPEYVFHAAAYKHVPMMEDNPSMAIQNNVYGTRVIADLSVKYGTRKFVMISTDKAVNPTNVMGCSKRICEIYCQSLNHKIQQLHKKAQEGTPADTTAKANDAKDAALLQVDGSLPVTQFVTTRFGNVLGSNGSVIPIFKKQIKKGGPVTVTHPDIIRFFMLISEACRLVLEAGTMGKGGEIFVFDMGEPVRIADLAQRMIELSHTPNVKIVYTGLRKGEKLYEEVLNNDELTKPTCHPKIKVAAVREYPYELALQNENELYELALTFNDLAIVRKMKAIVPEYKSQNSKYQILDEANDTDTTAQTTQA